MKTVNNQVYIPIPQVLERARSKSKKIVEEIVAPLNTVEKIDSAVEKYGSIYFKTDKDFEGETLDEYKEYMKYSLYKYVVLSLDINSQEFGDLSFDEINKYILHIGDKYDEMFLQFIYDSV